MGLIGWKENNMQTKINLRTRLLGADYCTSVANDENGHWYIKKSEQPYYVGTVHQVCKCLANDRTLKSIYSGGTYYTVTWFYKGKRITKIEGMDVDDVLNPLQHYLFDDDYMRKGVLIETE